MVYLPPQLSCLQEELGSAPGIWAEDDDREEGTPWRVPSGGLESQAVGLLGHRLAEEAS